MKIKQKAVVFMVLISIIILIISCSNAGAKELNIDKANKLLQKNTSTVLINVDTPMEYSMSHIEGDINIDVLAIGFSDKISMLEKTNNYIVYSKIKSRAVSAADIMIKQGISNVSVIDGEYTNIVVSIKR